jgi:hypothetical protein
MRHLRQNDRQLDDLMRVIGRYVGKARVPPLEKGKWWLSVPTAFADGRDVQVWRQAYEA